MSLFVHVGILLLFTYIFLFFSPRTIVATRDLSYAFILRFRFVPSPLFSSPFFFSCSTNGPLFSQILFALFPRLCLLSRPTTYPSRSPLLKRASIFCSPTSTDRSIFVTRWSVGRSPRLIASLDRLAPSRTILYF